MTEVEITGLSLISIGLGLGITVLAWHAIGLSKRLTDLEEKVNDIRKDRRRG